MAENNPNPQGGEAPKPAEGAKVQPKKETVRISLPPKPTASPTIKLPTLPPGAPPSAAAKPPATAAGAPAAPASTTAPPPPRPATGRASRFRGCATACSGGAAHPARANAACQIDQHPRHGIHHRRCCHRSAGRRGPAVPSPVDLGSDRWNWKGSRRHFNTRNESSYGS